MEVLNIINNIRLIHKKIRCRIVSYILHIAYTLKWTNIPILPINLNIEPINTCNLACLHCQVTYGDKATSQLTINKFIAIINQFPNLRWVKLQGMGEPLLNKMFPQLLKAAESRNIRTCFFSNGTIYIDKTAEELVKIKQCEIWFSIDAATKDNFEKLRVGSDFDEIIDNISKYVKRRNGKNIPQIGLRTLITRQNVKELSEIVSLAKKIGVDRLMYETFIYDWADDNVNSYINNNLCGINKYKLNKSIRVAEHLAKKLKIDINVYNKYIYNNKHICEWPFKSAFISANGDVVPCCFIGNSDIIKMGNIFDQNINEIWNSVEYRKFRLDHIENNIRDYCKRCYGK